MWVCIHGVLLEALGDMLVVPWFLVHLTLVIFLLLKLYLISSKLTVCFQAVVRVVGSSL